MTCCCTQFHPIELDRESINRRIKQSPSIRKWLTQIAEHTGLRLYLFRCSDCGQLWQSGHEGNFADQEYLFQVPPIDVVDWQNEPYQQPAAMMIYSAVMRDFYTRANFEPRAELCQTPGCSEHAIRFTIFCRRHHIESLQRLRKLPQNPVGRLFPPYYITSPSAG